VTARVTDHVTAADPAEIAVAFTQVLRGVGLAVPTSCTHTFAEALCATGIDDRHRTYWAGRATLVRRPEDIEPYDRAFAVFFEDRQGTGTDLVAEEPTTITIAVDSGDDDSDTDDSARQKMLDETPHILNTTPETLAILLNSPKFKQKLETVEYVVVDEIHSLADGKRGTHLAVSLERLERMAEWVTADADVCVSLDDAR